MSDYQRTVEFLRDFRASGLQTVTDDVREAAIAYAALCATANDRLRECCMLLQRGLRAEAVHLAETPPNLLDLVSALDLPDVEAWAELCQRADLPIPPPLQIDRAAQLNDAYGQDQPVAHLYAVHRRLALAHGPVVKRLDVMRQLAGADPSPFWEKDIRVFEAARFKELRVAFSAAMKDRDVPTINALSSEVLGSAWIEPVPADIATAAREVEERLELARGTAEVGGLVARLRTAFAAKSLAECTTLMSQLKELSATRNGAGLTEDAANEIRSTAAWIQRENQVLARNQAIARGAAALKRALDEDLPDKDLDIAYRSAIAPGEPLSPELSARYQAKVRSRARAARFRMVGLFAGVAAVLAIGLGIFYWRLQTGVAEDWSRRIRQAVTDRNLPLATQLVQEQEQRAPKASDDPDVVSAKKEVVVLQQQLDRDRNSVKSVLSAMEAVSKSAAAATASSNPEDWWSAAAAADEAIARAKKPADGSRLDPTNQIPAVAARLEGQRDALRRQYGSWVVAQVESASRKAAVVPDVIPKPASIAGAEAALAATEQELIAVRPYLNRAGDEARVAFDALTPRLARLREAIRRSRDELDARQALPGAAGSTASARRALQQFATQFPASPLSKDFTQAASVIDQYEAVERWNELTSSWAAAPAPPNEKTALKRYDQVQAFIRDNPQSPMYSRAVAYGDYLRQAAGAMSSPNTWQQQMGDVLSAPLISDLSYLESTDKTRYYTLGDPKVRQQGVGDRVRVVFDAIDPQNLAKKRPVTLPGSRGLVNEKPALVPHAVLARMLVEQMKTIDDRNWDIWGIDLVDRLVAEEGVDPIVRAILLREAMMATTQACGWALDDVYDRSIGDLTRQRLDLVVWHDLDHPVQPVTITSLKAIIAKVPRGDLVKKQVAARRAELHKGFRFNFAGTGLLLRDDDGHWQVVAAPGTPLADSAMAIVVAKDALRPAAAVSPPAVPVPVAASVPQEVPRPPPVSGPATAAVTAPPTSPATAPATGPAATRPAILAVAPPTPAVTAPVAPPAALPLVPAVPSSSARMIRVAKRTGPALVVDEAAVRELPEGTLVFLLPP